MPFTIQNRAAIVAFAKEHKIEHHVGFKNFSQNVILPESIVLDVQTKEELQQLILQVNKLNKDKGPKEKMTLRVAAGGKKQHGFNKEYSESFSFTPCAEADVIVRLVGQEFQKVEVVSKLKNLVRVGASVQVGDLDNTLYHQHQLVLPTSSLIPYVTFVGLAANAGHGTGRDQPGVAGLIRAMTICRPDGKFERIDANHPDFETIRASHFGLFGVVLNVEIECIQAKKLQCVTEARSINELIHQIKDGLFYKYPYVSIMYMPTYQEDDRNQRNVLVLRWEPVNLAVEDVGDRPEWNQFEQGLSIGINNLFNIPGFLEENSCVIPTFMKYFAARSQIGSKDSISVGAWPDMAHYQTAYPWHLDDADYLFATRGKSSDEIVKAIEHVVQKLEEYAKQGKYPVTNAIYIRFFKGTNGGLSTSATQHEDEHVCGFDIVSAPHVPGYDAFKAETEKFFLDQLKAKPHWGKSVPFDRNYAEMYGEQYKVFMQALMNWHKRAGIKLENNPFLNPFFRTVLQLPLSPTLAVQDRKEDFTKAVLAPLKQPPQEVARGLLAQISEAKSDNPYSSELQEQLETISREPTVVRFHFTSNEQRDRFFGSMRNQPMRPAAVIADEAKEEQKKQERTISNCCGLF